VSAPLDTLRAALHLERRKGTPFDIAWERARRTALLDLNDHAKRKQWREAIDATREAWAAAYEHRDESLMHTLVLDR
jgi:hypothetical protein